MVGLDSCVTSGSDNVFVDASLDDVDASLDFDNKVFRSVSLPSNRLPS